MAATTVSPVRLRDLAALREAPGKVLSLFLDLDPSTFGTQQARRMAVSSLLDEADKIVRSAELDHDEQAAARSDLERVRSWFNTDYSGEGLRGLALFVSSAADLFEVIGLERPIETAVVLDDGPYIEPLTSLASATEFCVLLANRRTARILRGTSDRLRPVLEISDDVQGQHRQGGWSQARYQRAITEDVQAHYRHVSEQLDAMHRRRPFGALIVGGPEGEISDAIGHLTDQVRRKLVGQIRVDVQHSDPQTVRDAAAPVFEQHSKAEERALLDRLKAGVGRPDGLGVHGAERVLAALNDARVEVLVVDHGLCEPGVVDPETGWLGPAGATEGPVPGNQLRHVEDIVERAVEKALGQDAEVLVVRHHQDLGPLGGIGAVLRF